MTHNTSVIIKNGTKTICQSIFDCFDDLTNFTIPNSLKNIQYYAFCGCSNLKEICSKHLRMLFTS